MTSPDLPPLPPGVECLTPDGPTVSQYEDGGLKFPMLSAHYRIHGLAVTVGWVVGHVMGSFREPNKLSVDFDSFDYARSSDEASGAGHEQAFGGITTSLLRKIPMAHARALMREQYERLSVAEARQDMTPLPARVDSDDDYVHVATAYVQLVGVSVEPIKRLAEWSGESVDTWSARLRRARAKGILEGKGHSARLNPSYLTKSNQIRATLREKRDKSHGD